MRALVVGSGGREHALAWKLLQSPTISGIFCIPGNGGTATLAGCRNLALAPSDFEGIARFALVNNCALVVIGPEQPLADGITDYLTSQGLNVFGPTQSGAQIEASKAWAKALMYSAQIPTAQARVFTEAAPAIAYVESQGIPIVVKADGLAAGKGVTVAHSLETAITAIEAAFAGEFGAAGHRVVIEDYLTGQEASVLAVTDGHTIRPLLPAQDHKPIGEGDTGPNTGGMGAYAPTPVVPPSLLERIQQEILAPTLAALRQQGILYRGVLYAGLMITPTGDPKVIEFNCRFGDPETQVVLPLLKTPLADLMQACLEERLDQFPPLQWHTGTAACVVAVAGGYPGAYKRGHSITGLEQAEAAEDVCVFQAGTQRQGQQLVTHGGRVLGITALGDTIDGALAKAYDAMTYIHFDGMYYRRDIGYRIKNH
ncbi:Phosphoribosylamine--glycine ligase [Halomicronema hongdechloris C2206]|uniref:Phosphoribosylamine--glycine ligase n=1 Tax=Halomicronema hongdechloris C2206 TaxID=1641165 RepID=A0A1Z3HJR6_9CYAN|nr:phosphoribosylamine--glycine ligase [Halomicronema hongdechloris]ASC70506.1 Phosphoribosylamine--glycine ligase [Halomicronema hongdechloris C2206]